MNTINHLLGTLGRLLIWVAGALVLEEMTLAGLARLIVRRVSEVRVAGTESADRTACGAAVSGNGVQGETSC